MRYVMILIMFAFFYFQVNTIFANSNNSIIFTPMVEVVHQNQYQSITLSITSNTDYTIIEDNKKRNIRRAVTVRLAHKVSKKDLIQIAKRIKNADRVKYKRTFIEYLLPGMVIGMGLWARTDFDPTLEVKIRGLTLEDQKALISKMTTKRSDEIGSWISECCPPGIITIYKKKGAFFLERNFADGSKSEEKVIRKLSSRGVQFLIINSSSGDYYLIDKSHNLQDRDKEGLMATMIRVPKK